jgi:hypothetical protein
MKLKKKQIYVLAGIAALGLGSYFMFRRRRIMFFDNVWCGDEQCSNIEDAISYCAGNTYDSDGDGIPDSPPPGGGRALSSTPDANKDPNKPGVTASCINEQSNFAEEQAIYDAQFANGLIDEDGNSLVNSEQEWVDLAIENEGGRGGRSWEDEGYTTGSFNIIFPEPHGLKVGDSIFVAQDQTNDTIQSYNGDTKVKRVYSEYIIGTDKPRVTDTPATGGYVVLPSVWNQLFS